jgi:hypothetical protein
MYILIKFGHYSPDLICPLFPLEKVYFNREIERCRMKQNSRDDYRKLETANQHICDIHSLFLSEELRLQLIDNVRF